MKCKTISRIAHHGAKCIPYLVLSFNQFNADGRMSRHREILKKVRIRVWVRGVFYLIGRIGVRVVFELG